MEFKPQTRDSDLVIQQSGSELLIYDLKTNTAQSLNETSARIWQSCNGEREVADICSYLEASDAINVNQDLVLLALRQLSDANLLAVKMPDPDKGQGVSRRKLLRQIGTGSAVTLPIIYSVVAPKASAASSIASGACTTRATFDMGDCPFNSRCIDVPPGVPSRCIPCVPFAVRVTSADAPGVVASCAVGDAPGRLCCSGRCGADGACTSEFGF